MMNIVTKNKIFYLFDLLMVDQLRYIVSSN